MIRISSEQELRDAFRPIDRDTLTLPPGAHFPSLLRSYQAWLDPTGIRVFLLMEDAATRRPLGIAFRRDPSSGASGPRMCDWCHSVRGADQVTLLTARVSPHRVVGLILCANLSCRENVAGLPGANDIPDPSGGRARLARVNERMLRFARQSLFQPDQRA